jgi:hypothetical protein
MEQERLGSPRPLQPCQIVGRLDKAIAEIQDAIAGSESAPRSPEERVRILRFKKSLDCMREALYFAALARQLMCGLD